MPAFWGSISGRGTPLGGPAPPGVPSPQAAGAPPVRGFPGIPEGLLRQQVPAPRAWVRRVRGTFCTSDWPPGAGSTPWGEALRHKHQPVFNAGDAGGGLENLDFAIPCCGVPSGRRRLPSDRALLPDLESPGHAVALSEPTRGAPSLGTIDAAP